MLLAQILAVTIFLVMFVMIVLEKIERHYLTLGAGLLTMILVYGVGMHSATAVWNTLSLSSFFTKTFWYTGGAGESASSGINSLTACDRSSFKSEKNPILFSSIPFVLYFNLSYCFPSAEPA